MPRLKMTPLEDRVTPSTLPAGFSEGTVVSGLNDPTSLAVAPDGRLFIAQQGGALRVVQNGSLLATPALTLNVDSTGERGLLGVAVDPAFASNQRIYLYYTRAAGGHQVSRFTLNGNTVVTGSETPLLSIPDSAGSTNHNGGALHFGPDGKLYIAKGDDAEPNFAQDLTNLHGKILRINIDGTIPSDNPFFATQNGDNRAIWAYGLRNPFTFAIQSGTGRMYINDVGQNTTEEVDDGMIGRNYGWPATEGPFNAASFPQFTGPVFSYPHGSGNNAGFAIAGGAFAPVSGSFPTIYSGDYFFADLTNNWIRHLDTTTNATNLFATGLPSGTVDLDFQSDGSLLVLSYDNGLVTRITNPGGQHPPTIVTPPQSATVSLTQSATFTVSASGPAPLSYQWQRNNADIPGATGATYTVNTASLADNGASFRVVVTNPFGSTPSNAATLTVQNNQPPVPTITSPNAGTLFRGGQSFTFSGGASDAEEGTLAAARLSWRVEYITGLVVRPFLSDTPGVATGTFTVPTVTPYTLTDVLYRITLTATDSSGATAETHVDLNPRISALNITTSTPGLRVALDGQPMTTPFSVDAVAGYERSITAVNQTVLGVPYLFQSWSDGGAGTHTITVPDVPLSLTASFAAQAVNQSTVLVGAREYALGGDTFARLLNPDGSERFSVTPFGDAYTAGVRVAAGDVNGDGIADLIAASGPGIAGRVRTYDGVSQAVLFEITPFGDAFSRGINVSAGDLTGDGRAEVVISPERGGGARIRVFSFLNSGLSQRADFFGLIGSDGLADTNYRGGARTAVGDVNGDGRGDLAFAAGAGGGPRVALFNGATLTASGAVKLRGDFFTFESGLRDGVNVALGDFDGDGLADLSAGAGSGGGPRVRVFAGNALLQNAEAVLYDYFADSTTSRGGVRVAVKNLDADGLADMLMGPGPGGAQRPKIYNGALLIQGPIFEPAVVLPPLPGFTGGVYVG